METTDSTNITCPNCGHSIDYHHPDEDAIIDACWAVAAPATDGDPEGLCPCSLRPSEIAGGLLDHAREDIPALLYEVERLQHRLDAVKARHTPVTVRYGDAPDELACRACGTHYEYPVAWPCPTVKAAKGEQR